MQGNEDSPVRQTDLVLIEPKDRNFSHLDFSTQSPNRLLHEPWQIRAKAHQEILVAEGDVLENAAAEFQSISNDNPAIYCLMPLAFRHGDKPSLDKIQALTNGCGNLAANAIRLNIDALSDSPLNAQAARLSDLVAAHALLEVMQENARAPTNFVIQAATHSDAYIRQSASQLLARTSTEADLLALSKGEADHRLASTLASGSPSASMSPVDGPPVRR